jgi:hypothetical protein
MMRCAGFVGCLSCKHSVKRVVEKNKDGMKSQIKYERLSQCIAFFCRKNWMMQESVSLICLNGSRNKLLKVVQQRLGRNGLIGQVYRPLKKHLKL